MHDGISEYATLYFLREISKGKNHLYVTIEETVKNYFKFFTKFFFLLKKQKN